MDNRQRATIAFLCGCISANSGQRYTSIYDYSSHSFVSYNYTKNGDNISIYDYRRGCYLSGRYPSFYDYGIGKYISLNRNGSNSYSVYDYNIGHYLNVTCNGNTISVFDYSVGQYFNYQIS